jgi:hypothetical protein
LDAVRALPPERQQTLLDFAEFLKSRSETVEEPTTGYGLRADLGVDLSDEDLKEARREMWAGFPRDITP